MIYFPAIRSIFSPDKNRKEKDATAVGARNQTSGFFYTSFQSLAKIRTNNIIHGKKIKSTTFTKILPLKKTLNIGHRGAKGHEPENTLPSFQKALDLNAHGIELDVHVCKTGELIVIHDFTVDRTTNGTGAVSELSLSEIKSLKINETIEIPTLEEVIDLVGKQCFINIELKGKHTAKPVSHLIEKYILENDFSYEDFIVSSFQREELEMLFAINPKIHLGVLSQASVAQALEWANAFSAKAIHPHFSLLTEENVQKTKELGLKIYTWTVNEIEDIERIKNYKVDGIITDFPERI